MKYFLSIFAFTILLSSCSSYQKAYKSQDLSVKYTEAEKMYNKTKYSKAIKLFEQIAPEFKGKPQSENMFYMYSMALYNSEQYYSAGYQLEKFVSSYPKSEHVEEAKFLGAKSFSLLSPTYSLDQADTEKAIEKMQSFIDAFPESKYLSDANTDVKMLREKLERKSFEIAKQYNQISDFKSALVAFENFIVDFPGTPYKEEALFYRLDSAYKLATNSIPSKMQDRLKESLSAYNNLIKFKADSQFKPKADKMLETINKDLQKFSN